MTTGVRWAAKVILDKYVEAEAWNTQMQLDLLIEFVQFATKGQAFKRFLESKRAPFRVTIDGHTCARFDDRSQCEAFIGGAVQWSEQYVRENFKIEERKA